MDGIEEMGSKAWDRKHGIERPSEWKESEKPESICAERAGILEMFLNRAAMARRRDHPISRTSKPSKNRNSTCAATCASATLIDSAG